MSDPTDIKLTTETKFVHRISRGDGTRKWCKAVVYTRFGIKTEEGACCAFYALEGSPFCKRHQNYKGRLNGRPD